MVERLLNVFHREWSGLHEAAFLLAGCAVLSQALGLFRDRMLAHQFGAGTTLDIYYAAFRIPDFLYASIASFVAVTVLIPFLLDRLTKDESGDLARRFINSVFTVFAFGMTFICLVVGIFTPFMAHFVVPGFTPSMQDEFILLTRILLFSPLLLGISNLFGTVTQSYRRFFVFALAPVLYNIGIIFGIVFLLPIFGIRVVVIGVIIGAALHMFIQIPVILRANLLPRFTLAVHWGDIKKVIFLSVPRTLALSSSMFATIILVGLASQMDRGSIAVFTFAMNLQNIPLTIVGMSYSVAAFPTLAKLWTGGAKDEFLGQIITATRHILFWSFPAIVFLIVLRAQIVRTILGSGLFDWTATRLTAAALALFALSVVAQSLVLLFTRAYYAMGKTREPLFMNMIGASTVVVSSFLLLYLFHASATMRFFFETILRVSDTPGTSVLMLCLGYSIGMLLNVYLLLRLLRRTFGEFYNEVRQTLLHSFTVSIIMGFVAYHVLQVLGTTLDLNTFFGIFFQGLISGIVGILVGVFLLRLMDNRELEEIWKSLHHKFWKVRPIATEQESI